MLQIYDNGTLISVGTRDNKMDVQNDEVDRVIYKYSMEGNQSYEMKVQEFKAFLNASGFFDLPSDRYSVKSNKICDTYYRSQFTTHEVCNMKGDTTRVFEEIRQAIKRIFLTSYSVWEYTPNQFYIATVLLSPGNYNYNRVNNTSSSALFSYFDPDGIYFKNTYATDCWIHTTIFNPYSPFMDAVNMHKIYSDGTNVIRFVVWIPELSISNVLPNPRTTTNYYSFTIIDSFNDFTTTYWLDPHPGRNGNEFLIISIFLVVILFISLGVACIIRRNRMKKAQSNDEIFENYLSDSEILSEEGNTLYNPQPVQTSFPIFVSTNPMQSNTQPYPIFVSTNPMQSNTNPQMSNPIVFPQPTLFYPQSTNQN